MITHKGSKKLKFVEPVSVSDTPYSYIQSSGMMLLEKGGQSKLRARNDQIHGDLLDVAKRSNLRLESKKQGGRTWYIIPNMGITVCLVNG